ncbi:MAG: oxidoreductase [Bacteroides sp. SM23_62_1]|nr:MAG: oxidoreductase [Bacteroides sp. SM23_62_1]
MNISSKNKSYSIGIIMNGVTGRMGTNQHLMRSIVAIREQGGICDDNGRCIIPEPILVGRNKDKLKQLAEISGCDNYSTDLEDLLRDPDYQIYFDAQITKLRYDAIKAAILSGKHIYCEKPSAADLISALELYRLANEAGVKHGVVQDKLWLPGIQKLIKLRDSGFFGKILAVKGDFGYWVFEGFDVPSQRPSWNYRKEEGGGLIIDMLCHWRYLLDNLFGDVKSVCCLGATHIPQRMDESGAIYHVTTEDAAYTIFELEGGIIAQFNSSWVSRVRRDDLLIIQVDGTKGSAVAGLRDTCIQDYKSTPRPVWNPDVPKEIDYFRDWQPVYEGDRYENAFKVQWELFLRHVAWDEPFRWDLMEGAKGLQLAEAAHRSWRERRWIELDRLV